MGIDRPVRAQHGKPRQHLDQVPELVHRATPEIFKTEFIAHFTVAQEPVEPVHVTRAQPCDLQRQPRDVAGGIVAGAIGPADLVEGIERAQIDVSVKVASTGCPKLFKNVGHRDNRRPQIKAVPILGDGRAAPSGAIEAIQHRDLIPFGAQPHRGRKPTKTSTYDKRGLATKTKRSGCIHEGHGRSVNQS